MSAFIGDLRNGIGVWASRGAVELGLTNVHSVSPLEARNLAALLVRAADECERMRARPDGGMCDFALPRPLRTDLPHVERVDGGELKALLDAVRDAEEYKTPTARAVVVEAAITFARSQRT